MADSEQDAEIDMYPDSDYEVDLVKTPITEYSPIRRQYPDIEQYVAPYFVNTRGKPPCVCKTMHFIVQNGVWCVDVDDVDISLPTYCNYSRFLHHLRYLKGCPDESFKCWHDEGEARTCDIFVPQWRSQCGVKRVTTDHHGPFAKYFTRRVVLPDPCSEPAWSMIQGWIEECDNWHHRCHRSPAALPFRVLAIPAEGNIIKIVEGNELSDPYVALSHCWGSNKTISTTRETLAAHKIGIQISDLPQTFNDAITITRKLGIKYLWIDSLCIIQQDLKDWETESSKMGQIYSNSYLTIAATRAAGDDEGFLQPRESDAASPIKDYGVSQEERNFHEILLTSSGQPLGPVYFSSSNNWVNASELSGSTDTDNWKAPLLFRAWTLQERYLASRTLSFMQDQVMFECVVQRQFEGGQNTEESVSGNSIESLLPLPYLSDHSSQQAPCFLSPQRSFDAWYSMVSAYTMRSLTYPIDKLPALSGLASRIGVQTDSPYYAGIWGEDFFTGLLWYAPFGARCKRRQWRAPSWSWASIDGEVKFPTDEITNPGQTSSVSYPFDIAALYGYSIGSTLVLGLCVHHVEVKTGDDVFGKAEGGKLELSAIAMILQGPKFSWMNVALCPDLKTEFIFDNPDKEGKLWSYQPDAYTPRPVSFALFIMETTPARIVRAKREQGRYYDCFPSDHLQDNEEPIYCGIVVQRIEKDNMEGDIWQRIGLFKTAVSYGKLKFDIRKQVIQRFTII